MERFSFYISSEGKSTNIEFECESWVDALTEFKNLIHSTFGYSIEDQVAVIGRLHKYNDKWTGPVFDGEEYRG